MVIGLSGLVLCGIKRVIFNPNLHPELTLQGRIDRLEVYEDISTKCVEKFRAKNQGRCLLILSRQDEIHDNQKTAQELQDYYDIVWKDTQTHNFKISHHLQAMKAFKAA